MPLSAALANVLLTYACPHCGFAMVRRGRAFQTMARYRCGSCGREVRMTYDMKVRLFDANAHLKPSA